jgi:hypothetical protein
MGLSLSRAREIAFDRNGPPRAAVAATARRWGTACSGGRLSVPLSLRLAESAGARGASTLMPFDRGQTDAAWSQPGEAGHFMFLFNEHRLAHLKQPQSTQQLEWPLYRIDFGPMLRSKAAIRFAASSVIFSHDVWLTMRPRALSSRSCGPNVSVLSQLASAPPGARSNCQCRTTTLLTG